MENKKRIEKILLPTELYKQLEIDEEQAAKLEVLDASAQGISFKSLTKQAQTLRGRWWVIPTVISLIYLVFGYWNYMIQAIVQHQSVRMLLYTTQDTKYASVENIAVSGLVFISTPLLLIAYLITRRKLSGLMGRRTYWLVLPALLIAWYLLTSTIFDLLFKVMNSIFPGVILDIFTAIFLATLIIAGVNYLLISFINHFSLIGIKNLLGIMIASGVTSAALNSGKSNWWQRHFSYLGSSFTKDNYTFNLTLIIVGFLLAILFDRLMTQLVRKYNQTPIRFNFFRLWLILCGISLSCVGLFPNNGNIRGGWVSMVHNVVAGLIVLFLLICMIGIQGWLPQAGRHFYGYTYVLLAGLVVVVGLFYGIHYLSLTAFELLSFTLAFAWLFSLIKLLTDLVKYDNRVYLVVESE